MLEEFVSSPRSATRVGTGADPSSLLLSPRAHSGLHVVPHGVPALGPSVFQLDMVQYTVQGRGSHLKVGGNTLYLVTDGRVLVRIDLTVTEGISQIELPRLRADDAVQRTFLDPTGAHLLVSMRSGDAYYLHRRWRKPKLLSKLRGSPIAAVAFPPARHDGTSGPLVIALARGTIVTLTLDPSEELLKSAERHFRQLYVLPHSPAITRLELEPLSSGAKQKSGSNNNSTTSNFALLVSTAETLYVFAAPLDLRGALAGESLAAFFELKHHEIQHGRERTGAATASSASMAKMLPRVAGGGALVLAGSHADSLAGRLAAWVTAEGIAYASLDGDSTAAANVLGKVGILPIPEPRDDFVGFSATAWHCVLLYRRKVCAVRWLDAQTVWEQLFSDSGSGGGGGEDSGEEDSARTSLEADRAQETLWLFSGPANTLFEVLVHNELAGVSDALLALRPPQFERALETAQSDAQRCRVLDAHGAHYFFVQGQHLLAATCWGRGAAPLEETALLLQQHDAQALLAFLQERVCALQRRQQTPAEHATQMTLLSMWCLDLHLAALSNARSGDAEQSTAYLRLRNAFGEWVAQQRAHLDAALASEMIESCDLSDVAALFARATGDADRVMAALLLAAEEQDASIQGERDANADLLQYLAANATPALLAKWSLAVLQRLEARDPAVLPRLVRLWTDAGRALDPRRLVPCLMHMDASRALREHALAYLAHASPHSTDPAVHNLHLLLLVHHGDGEAVLDFVCDPAHQLHLDLHYALRIVPRESQSLALVQCYGLLGMYDEAVALCLEAGSVDRALYWADASYDLHCAGGIGGDAAGRDSEVEVDEAALLARKRKLWLDILEWVLRTDGVKAAVDLLPSSSDPTEFPHVTLGDILPWFPPDLALDDIHAPLKELLGGYAARLEELRLQMQDASEAAALIRTDLVQAEHRWIAVAPRRQRCGLCARPCFQPPGGESGAQAYSGVYAFPCSHAFHMGCLVQELIRYAPARLRAAVTRLDAQYRSALAPPQPQSQSQSQSSLLLRATLQRPATNLSLPALLSPASNNNSSSSVLPLSQSRKNSTKSWSLSALPNFLGAGRSQNAQGGTAALLAAAAAGSSTSSVGSVSVPELRKRPSKGSMLDNDGDGARRATAAAATAAAAELAAAEAELDALLGAECALCGEVAILKTAEPFTLSNGLTERDWEL